MNWTHDETGRFKQRPFFTETEIDRECEGMVAECLKTRNKFPFSPPLDTDTLQVLLEMHAQDVNLYADLSVTEGPGVEGMTEFQKGKSPKISIDKRLSEGISSNRLRSTMAHELFHARFHRYLWELYWLGKAKKPHCHESAIVISGKADWYEWQAAYGGGSILMPRSAISVAIGAGPTGATDTSTEGQALITKVSEIFQVSRDAARIRLTQLKVLKGSRPTTIPVMRA